jgi:hypothetical protein
VRYRRADALTGAVYSGSAASPGSRTGV